MDSAIEKLQSAHGGYWGTVPNYPVADWQYAVANGDTRHGYWEWVLAEQEMGR